jgi:predicted nucleic acid-binding protein
VFEAVEGGLCEFYYSVEIVSETRRVLQDKFGWDEYRLDRYLPGLWSFGERVISHRRVNAVKDDPDDNRILECALAAGAEMIVSGDGHLLRLTAYEGIAILTPARIPTHPTLIRIDRFDQVNVLGKHLECGARTSAAVPLELISGLMRREALSSTLLRAHNMQRPAVRDAHWTRS